MRHSVRTLFHLLCCTMIIVLSTYTKITLRFQQIREAWKVENQHSDRVIVETNQTRESIFLRRLTDSRGIWVNTSAIELPVSWIRYNLIIQDNSQRNKLEDTNKCTHLLLPFSIVSRSFRTDYGYDSTNINSRDTQNITIPLISTTASMGQTEDLRNKINTLYQIWRDNNE